MGYRKAEVLQPTEQIVGLTCDMTAIGHVP
jgi:hypothetical protein